MNDHHLFTPSSEETATKAPPAEHTTGMDDNSQSSRGSQNRLVGVYDRPESNFHLPSTITTILFVLVLIAVFLTLYFVVL